MVLLHFTVFILAHTHTHTHTGMQEGQYRGTAANAYMTYRCVQTITHTLVSGAKILKRSTPNCCFLSQSSKPLNCIRTMAHAHSNVAYIKLASCASKAKNVCSRTMLLTFRCGQHQHIAVICRVKPRCTCLDLEREREREGWWGGGQRVMGVLQHTYKAVGDTHGSTW